jgi:hypothetical protein
MSDNEIQKAQSPYSYLTDRERFHLELYEQKGGPRISPTTQAQFYALFIHGKSCDDIAELNKGFPLGAIIKARVEGEWDRRLNEYRDSLFADVHVKLAQVETESIHFLADMLSAVHKQQGQKIQKYIQTGDEGELGDMKITSIKNYKEVLELLIKATGQDRHQTVEHKHQVTPSQEGTQVISVKTLTGASSDKATEILKLLDKKE